jgi:hypothetical protein
MAISVTLHLSEDGEEDVHIEDIGFDNIPDWLRSKQAFGGILCDTWKGTTPFIPFEEVLSFWFHDESFVDDEVKPEGLVH